MILAESHVTRLATQVADATVNPVAHVIAKPIETHVIRPISDAVHCPEVEEFLKPVVEHVIHPVYDATLRPIVDVLAPSDHTIVVERVQDPTIGVAIELTLLEQQKLKEDLAKLQEQLAKLQEDQDEVDEGEDPNLGATSLKKIFKLAKKVPPQDLPGNHIALFGINGVGKSTLVNAFTNSSVAAVGPAHSTDTITAYQGNNYTIHDLPGLNDNHSYFTNQYISLIKGVRHRVVMITSTVKQVKKLINLFESLNLSFDIVVNKFDLIEFEQREQFQSQIKAEVHQTEWKHLNRLWFISATQPGFFPDWLKLIDHLTQ